MKSIFLTLFILFTSFTLTFANSSETVIHPFEVVDSEIVTIKTTAEPITITVVGTVILVKKAGAAITIGAAYGAKAWGLAKEALSIYAVYTFIDQRNRRNELEKLLEMSNDELYDYCHELGGGMASTNDIRENVWGDSLIFGVLGAGGPTDARYSYAGAVCVGN